MADVTLAEIKAAFEQEARLNEEFRKTNDQRLKSLETRGESDPLFDEKLDRINAAMAQQEKILRAARKQQDEVEAKRLALAEEATRQQDEALKKIEAKVNRAVLGLGGAPELEESINARLHQKAMNGYLRRGETTLSPEEVKVLVVANDVGAGYLAPSDFQGQIVKAMQVFSPVRDLVTVVDISGPSLKIPLLTGTVPAATRVGEVTTRVESTNPTYGMADIQCPEMYAEHRVSQQQLEDAAFDVEAELAQFMGWQFASKEGAEFISGTGVGQMKGLQNSSITSVNSEDADAVTADGIISLIHALPTPYARNAVLLLTRKTLGAVRKLKASTSGEYIWQRGYDVANPPTICGERYVEVPDMDEEGTNKYPIAFGDFKLAFKLVTKVGTAVLRDPYSLQSVGQVKISARRRVGGQVVLADAVRLLKCATT